MGHVEGFRKVGRKARRGRKRKPEPHTANRGSRGARSFGGTRQKKHDARRRDEKRLERLET